MQLDEIEVIVRVGGIPLFVATLEQLQMLRRFGSYMNDSTLHEIGRLLSEVFGSDGLPLP